MVFKATRIESFHKQPTSYHNTIKFNELSKGFSGRIALTHYTRAQKQCKTWLHDVLHFTFLIPFPAPTLFRCHNVLHLDAMDVYAQLCSRRPLLKLFGRRAASAILDFYFIFAFTCVYTSQVVAVVCSVFDLIYAKLLSQGTQSVQTRRPTELHTWDRFQAKRMLKLARIFLHRRVGCQLWRHPSKVIK